MHKFILDCFKILVLVLIIMATTFMLMFKFGPHMTMIITGNLESFFIKATVGAAVCTLITAWCIHKCIRSVDRSVFHNPFEDVNLTRQLVKFLFYIYYNGKLVFLIFIIWEYTFYHFFW